LRDRREQETARAMTVDLRCRPKRLTVPLPDRKRRKKGVRAHQKKIKRERPKQMKSLKRSTVASIDEEGRRRWRMRRRRRTVGWRRWAQSARWRYRTR
jgi:hypothetical protein